LGARLSSSWGGGGGWVGLQEGEDEAVEVEEEDEALEAAAYHSAITWTICRHLLCAGPQSPATPAVQMCGNFLGICRKKQM
jgi:hypothetical protein